MYITNDIKQKPIDNSATSDTECSTASASPTFSDVSSDTTSSCTPSTDTVNDDPPPTNHNESVEDMVSSVTPPISIEDTPPVPEVGGASGDGIGSMAGNLYYSLFFFDSLMFFFLLTEWLGKQAPLWIPDSEAASCLHCDTKFTVLKRRHHCRACGFVLCSKCCSLRLHLAYLDDVARVCQRCHSFLIGGSEEVVVGVPTSRPNPNNPAEYCSTLPPHQQVNEKCCMRLENLRNVGGFR